MSTRAIDLSVGTVGIIDHAATIFSIAGIDSIWLNPAHRPGGGATYLVQSLDEALTLLLS